MKNEYTYYAFISYNHLDEKWARKLQYKLHHYRLPSVARKEVGEDVRIRPVFRYVTNLSLGDLRENLNNELEESKYLIVICSPNSAQPNIKGEHWVNDEISKFIALGRKDRIIPVIVAGKPNSGDVATECFPPALRTAEIAGADLSSGSRAERLDSFLKIVAKLLNLKPDQLIRLTEREDRRRWIMKCLCIVPLLLFGIFGGLFTFDAMRTAKNYYADYVDSFGLPEGIFKLTKPGLEHRNVHYRFEYRGFQFRKSPHADSADWCFWKFFGLRRKLVRVVQANSSGTPIKKEHVYENRPLVQDFEYDESSRLREIRIGKVNGDRTESSFEKRVELFNEDGVINGLLKFFSSKGQLGVAYDTASMTKVGEGLSSKSEIAQHLVQRNERGGVVQRLFLNLSGANVADSDGLYGFTYEYDDRGRQTAQWYLSRAGNGFARRANKKGVAGCKYEYEGRNMYKVEFVDPKERHIVGPQGWMVRKDKFDEFDNIKEFWFEDGNGRKALCVDGYVGCSNEYDARGNRIKAVYLGMDGKAVLLKDGYAEVRMEYDCGNMTRISCFGVNGETVLSKDGYAEVRMEYEHGNMTRKVYLGVDGKPSLAKAGYAEIRIEQEFGNVTRVSYFGTDGRLMLQEDGYAEVRMEYEHGNMTKMLYFGVDGKPVLHNDGYAEVRMEYEHGNLTKVLFFNIFGKPTLSKDGYAEVHMKYEYGNMTKKAYFGVDGKAVLHKNGYAEVCSEYKNGNLIKVAFLDVAGSPTLGIGGYAEVRRSYNAYGNMTEELYLGTDGKPMLNERGFAGWRSEYDEHGNMTNRVYLGVDGLPTVTKGGYSEVRREYDADGNLMREQHLNVKGNSTQDECEAQPLAYLIDVCGKVTIVRNGKKREIESSCELLNSSDELDFTGDAKGMIIYEDAFYDVSGPVRCRIVLPDPLRIDPLGNNKRIAPQFTTRGTHLGLWDGDAFVISPITMLAQVKVPTVRASDADVQIFTPCGACFDKCPRLGITGDSNSVYEVSVIDMENNRIGGGVNVHGGTTVDGNNLFTTAIEEDEIYTIRVTLNGKTVNELSTSTFWLVGNAERTKIDAALKNISSLSSDRAKDFFTANVLYANGCYSEAYLLARKLHGEEMRNGIYTDLLKLCSKALGIR